MKSTQLTTASTRSTFLPASLLTLGLLFSSAVPVSAQSTIAPEAPSIGTSALGSKPAINAAGGRALSSSARGLGIVPTSATAAQRAYLASPMSGRIKLIEEVGEVGARQWASTKGWTEILPAEWKVLPQGPDQVYWAKNGIVHVLEAKGGGSPLNNAYGHLQGSVEWAVKSAGKVATSPKASLAERRSALAVIRAASEGRLQVHVVRTRHVLGKALEPVLLSTKECSRPIRKSALQTWKKVSASPAAIEALAGSSAKGLAGGEAMALKVANGGKNVTKYMKLLGPMAVIVDGGLRANKGMTIAESYANGDLTAQEHELIQVENAAGMAGGWGGAWAGGTVGVELCTCFGPWGATLGGLGGGVAGYFVGEQAVEAGAVYAIEVLHSSGRTIGGVAASGWDATAEGASSAWGWTSGKAGAAWSWIAD